MLNPIMLILTKSSIDIALSIYLYRTQFFCAYFSPTSNTNNANYISLPMFKKENAMPQFRRYQFNGELISIVIAYLCKQLIQTSREMCSAYLSKKMSCIQCLSANTKRHAISMFKIFIVLFLACNVLVLTPNYKIISENAC